MVQRQATADTIALKELIAVLGGVAGQAIEEKTSRKDGLEITIRLDNGQIIAVTQEADESFRAGERVRVLSGSGVTTGSR